jgi:hypothetical protein
MSKKGKKKLISFNPMSISDPRIIRALKTYILGLEMNPKRKKQIKMFLDTFLEPLIVAEMNPEAHSISLSATASLTGIPKADLKRMIDPTFARQNRKLPEYKENQDFRYYEITDSLNRPREELYMTVGRFV